MWLHGYGKHGYVNQIGLGCMWLHDTVNRPEEVQSELIFVNGMVHLPQE